MDETLRVSDRVLFFPSMDWDAIQSYVGAECGRDIRSMGFKALCDAIVMCDTNGLDLHPDSPFTDGQCISLARTNIRDMQEYLAWMLKIQMPEGQCNQDDFDADDLLLDDTQQLDSRKCPASFLLDNATDDGCQAAPEEEEDRPQLVTHA